MNKFIFRTTGSDGPSIPDAVIELMTRTKRLYRLWWCAHYTFGLAGVVAGTLLAVLTTAPPATDPDGAKTILAGLKDYALLIGIIATVSTSMVTFLGPLHKAERYWSAYHHLEQACLEYFGQDLDPRTKKLMKRVMQARRILQVVDPDEKIAAMGADAANDPAKGLV